MSTKASPPVSPAEDLPGVAVAPAMPQAAAGVATFTFPNRILFGEGARRSIGAELARLGVRHPLVVTDKGIVAAGLLGEITDGWSPSAVVDGVQANPTEDDVLAALAVYRDHDCDGLVALGGGSPIDAAKAVRLLATHEGRLADYDVTAGGLERITANLPPMIAVPTTSGTGSEAGRGTLIQLRENGRKTAVLSPHLLPSVAVCDPELTYSLPAELTAGAGMDAFTHGIESYLSTTIHPICDGIALEGLKYVAKGLESATRDGSDRPARRSLMMGALMGGISFHKGLGVIHSLSHALGSEGRAHHGTLNAILLPHGLRFNRPMADERMADIAARLGVGRGGSGAEHLVALSELVLARLPLPRRLRDVPGLERGRIVHYARLALQDHCHRTNPRPCTVADFESILERAW